MHLNSQVSKIDKHVNLMWKKQEKAKLPCILRTGSRYCVGPEVASMGSMCVHNHLLGKHATDDVDEELKMRLHFTPYFWRGSMEFHIPYFELSDNAGLF